MAQHDYVIANGTGAAVRSDLNNALAAIVTQNSGPTAPATTYAYQWWADTTTGLLKLRNGANNAWITLRELDGTLTIEDGTASSPGLAFADDLNTGIYSPSADQLGITTGGTVRLTTTTTGITSALPVDVPLGTASAPTVTFTGDLNTGIYSPGADQVAISTSGAGRVFVDSSGRLLVGTSTARDLGDGGNHQILLEGTTGPFSSSGLVCNTNDTGAAYFTLAKTRGTAVGSNTVVASGDFLGHIQFNGADGTDVQTTGARISAVVDGTPGSNDLPTRLVFSTTADGASSPTERMRITNAGAILINRTDRNTSELVSASGNCGDSGGLVVLKDTGAAGANRDFIRFYNASNSDIGAIEHNNTDTVAFITSSDYRLKENVVPLRNAIDRLAAIPVHRFNFISSPDITCDGFLAHEVQPIVPEAISGEKDAVNEDGSIRPQGIDQSKLVPLLTAALQEAIGEIESLKARVAALETA